LVHPIVAQLGIELFRGCFFVLVAVPDGCLIQLLHRCRRGLQLGYRKLLRGLGADGGGHQGKIIGVVWDAILGKTLTEAADAFWPAMDNPDVVEYLRGKASIKGVEPESIEEIQARADKLLATVGLTDKADSYPCQLSGGQQQRVAIARALMLSPDILCFDEPTSSLDPELTGEVLRVIRSLKDSERTMIIVTHEMEFAKHVADKIIFIADGVIEEAGTPDEVFGNPQSEKTKAFLRAGEE